HALPEGHLPLNRDLCTGDVEGGPDLVDLPEGRRDPRKDRDSTSEPNRQLQEVERGIRGIQPDRDPSRRLREGHGPAAALPVASECEALRLSVPENVERICVGCYSLLHPEESTPVPCL